MAQRNQKCSPSHRQLWAPCSALARTSGGTASGGKICRLSVQPCVHVPRCVLCCAWFVPRPYTCVCVYVCVCRCVLPCLSFWCMCRSGVWLSCRVCVLVPLFSSEQCLVSWCPSRRSPFLPPPPWNPEPRSSSLPSRLLCAPYVSTALPLHVRPEPKPAQSFMAGEAFGFKCEGGVGWAGKAS